jgi:hypothetical protein
MLRKLMTLVAATLLVGSVSSPVFARGGIQAEPLWASSHFDHLPEEIRQSVKRKYRACGEIPAAQQHFGLYLGGPKYKFVALHFEEFQCRDRSILCTEIGCLHQVYVSSGGTYHLVFSTYVADLRMKTIDSTPALELTCATKKAECSGTRYWNGASFR